MKTAKDLTQAVKDGDLVRVKEIITTHPNSLFTEALIQASVRGHLEIVKALIPVSNPNDSSFFTLETRTALSCAAEQGHLAVVNLLLPVSDPKKGQSLALSHAAAHGHLEIVKRLIPLSNAQDESSRALRRAIEGQHVLVAKRLIPVSDIRKIVEFYMQHNEHEKMDFLVSLLPSKLVKKMARRIQTEEQMRAYDGQNPGDILTRMPIMQAWILKQQLGKSIKPSNPEVKPRIRI